MQLLPMLILMVLIGYNKEAEAHWNPIPDGNAVWGNYSPYAVDPFSYHHRWTTKGDKTADFTSGRRLVYDIYSGNSGQNYKAPWRIQWHDFGQGNQPYLIFEGWSALVGYHHHDWYNQATYIVAWNPDTGEEKMYKAEMNPIHATKDIEYNRRSNDENVLYRPCGPDVFNRVNDSCNFWYQYVGFKAYLPLNELFPQGTENKKWRLYIVKNVENNVVYDELRVPFRFNNLDYNNGKISLSSGLNAQTLIMNSSGVIRREYPRQAGYSGGKYFTLWRNYSMRAMDESTGAAVWYGVATPEDGGATRWTSSVYWTFAGDQAEISFQVTKKTCPDGSVVNIDQNCQVNVSINHIDGLTGGTIKSETKKATVGKSYSFSPEPKGVLKDSKGNPYVPTPENQTQSGITPNNNMTINFYYKASLPNPTAVYEMKGATAGKAKGEVGWQLNKENESSLSQLLVYNQVEIQGKHYDTRNALYQISATGVMNLNDKAKQLYALTNPNALKNKTVQYKFSYEYTNHYRKNYKCVDSQGDDCFQWEYVNDTPAWDDEYKKQALWEKELKVDHQYGETFTFTGASSPNLSVMIGRKGLIDGEQTAPIKDESYKETFTVNKKPISLLSQNWKPIYEQIDYVSDLKNKVYVIPDSANMYYYPYDLDNNLKNKYRNNTPYKYSDYAIPLRVGEQNENTLVFQSADNFYLTEKVGFIFSVPASENNMIVVENKAKQEYEAFTGKAYDDRIVNNTITGSRYYLNVDGNGDQKAKTWYADNFVIGKIGLSDVTFNVDRQIQFEKYLLGSALDNTLINEQQESVIEGITYNHSITINPTQNEQIRKLSKNRGELLHSFRSTDIQEIYNQLKAILPSFDT